MSDTKYDNTNRGALFKNKSKKSETSPDYRGEVNVDGETFFLSAWLKISKGGDTYMSLSLTPKGDWGNPSIKAGGIVHKDIAF